jgi:hypothetical protein
MFFILKIGHDSGSKNNIPNDVNIYREIKHVNNENILSIYHDC